MIPVTVRANQTTTSVVKKRRKRKRNFGGVQNNGLPAKKEGNPEEKKGGKRMRREEQRAKVSDFVAREEDRQSKPNGDTSVEYHGQISLSEALQIAKDKGMSELELDMPPADSDAGESFKLAADQAFKVHANYRYGASLVTGDDFMPVRMGCNGKPFKRKEIHAEAAALKGAPFLQTMGKIMLIVRLPPRSSKDTDGKQYSRYLNARPCEKCYEKMRQAGIRYCAFTKPKKARIGFLLFPPPLGTQPPTEPKNGQNKKNKIKSGNLTEGKKE